MQGELLKLACKPGRANLVFGWIYAGHQLGAAGAAFGAGLPRTELASYLPAFFAAGCGFGLALQRPRRALAQGAAGRDGTLRSLKLKLGTRLGLASADCEVCFWPIVLKKSFFADE